MKNLFILAIIFFIYAIVYVGKTYTIEENFDTAEHRSITVKEVEPKHINKEIKKITVASISNKAKVVTTNTRIPQIITPFIEEDIDDTKLTISPLANVHPISAVRIASNTIKQSKEGDTILLPSIDGTVHELLVTHSTVSSNGNATINGIFEENGITYHTVITEGTKITLLTLNTPTGSYQAELVNGLGYMYLSKDIENERIDYTKSDVMEHIGTHQEEITS